MLKNVFIRSNYIFRTASLRIFPVQLPEKLTLLIENCVTDVGLRNFYGRKSSLALFAVLNENDL
jgi:hypothetical protein